MDTILKNELKKLSYQDPEQALKTTAVLHAFTSATRLSPKHRDWRHHRFDNDRESEQAAWFAYGLKKIGLKPRLQFSHFRKKDRDFDAALRWGDAASPSFATLQLKEVVCSELCLSASLEAVIAKFEGYAGRDELIGAIFVNRDLVLDPKALKIPALKLRELWIYGLSDCGEPRLFFLGDLLAEPQQYTITIPNLRWEVRDLPWRRGV
jgi:hypothetical protein